MMNVVITKRREALCLGLKFYFTGKPCINGHWSKRYSNGGHCIKCLVDRGRSPKIKIYKKKYRESPLGIKSGLKYRASGKAKEWQKRYDASAKAKQRKKLWRKQNSHKDNATQALRRARKINATPPWLTTEQKKEIQKFYIDAQDQGLTVDHIVPLKGKHVCGLHIPHNLQLLSVSENSSKGNSHG